MVASRPDTRREPGGLEGGSPDSPCLLPMYSFLGVALKEYVVGTHLTRVQAMTVDQQFFLLHSLAHTATCFFAGLYTILGVSTDSEVKYRHQRIRISEAQNYCCLLYSNTLSLSS
jgi:hypothetical protein